MRYQEFTISCPEGITVSASTLDELQTKVRAEWDSVIPGNPTLTVSWSEPVIDMQYQWYPNCHFNRSLNVDWYAPTYTKISSGAPVFCFFNSASRNRLTVALSDALNSIGLCTGVHEEDGTFLFSVEIPLDTNKKDYEFVLYRDRSDISFAETLRRVSLWWEKGCGYTPARVPEAARSAMYSFWYSFHQNVIAENTEAECARAAALGLKTVIVDDGWQTDDNNRGYAYCGDWEPTPGKIPDMAKHVQNVHDMGLKYVLWYSVPFIGIHSGSFARFKDKLLCMNDRLNTGVLDPRYPDVRQYLIDTYVKALKEWNLDGFKLDFIDSFRSDSIPPYNAAMDYSSVEEAVNRLMLDVLGALKSIKPDILIEFRQSYIGPIMRTFGNMFRVGDCPDDAISNRVGTIDLRLLSGNTAVHSDMLMWHKYELPQAAALQLQSVLFSVPQISVNLDGISGEHKKLLTFWLNFIETNKSLLLDAPLEVEAPHNLYPVVKAEKDRKAIIAVYDGGRIVDIPENADEVLIVNANYDKRLILSDSLERSMNIEIMDCMGEHVSRSVQNISTAVISVPACGIIRLTKA